MTTRAHNHATHEGGFTLLELMTVLGVIAILSGIGIGFLTRSDNDIDVALAIARDKIRLAHEIARNSGRPTAVEMSKVFDEDQSLMGYALQAKILEAVGNWHLEPDERAFGGLDPDIKGDYDPDGRFGQCLRANLETEDTLFSVQTKDESRFFMRDGFALRVEVYLEKRARCVVATMTNTFHLELDDDLIPQARMFLRDGVDRGPSVSIDLDQHALALNRWVSLELIHDGRTFDLRIDGEVVASKSAEGELFQDGQPFEISPAGSLIPGKVDEIQLLAYSRDVPVTLPADVEVKGFEKPLRFDSRGRLQSPRPAVLEFAQGDQKRTKTVAPGGVLQ